MSRMIAMLQAGEIQERRGGMATAMPLGFKPGTWTVRVIDRAGVTTMLRSRKECVAYLTATTR